MFTTMLGEQQHLNDFSKGAEGKGRGPAHHEPLRSDSQMTPGKSGDLICHLLRDYHPHRNYYRPVFCFGQFIKIM